MNGEESRKGRGEGGRPKALVVCPKALVVCPKALLPKRGRLMRKPGTRRGTGGVPEGGGWFPEEGLMEGGGVPPGGGGRWRGARRAPRRLDGAASRAVKRSRQPWR